MDGTRRTSSWQSASAWLKTFGLPPMGTRAASPRRSARPLTCCRLSRRKGLVPLSLSLSLTVCRSSPLTAPHCFCVSQILNQQTLTKMLREELTARAVYRNSDLHASGAGDQECDALTKALDDALQLRDDADALAAGKCTQTQKERQHQARLKEEGDRIRAQSLGMVTSRHNLSSPKVSVHLW